MIALRAFALLLFGLLGFATAAKMPDLSVVPKCAIGCILQAVPHTNCSLTDQACLCVDPGFNAAVAPCIKANCTIKEALAVANQTWAQCDFPLTNETAKIHWVTGIIIVISTVFMMMRLAAKAFKLSTWGVDDTVILVAFALVVAYCVVLYYTTEAGLGRDIWTLHDFEITYFLKLLYVLEFLYMIGLSVIKASILFFFLKIFPDRRFRKSLWFMMGLNVLVGSAFVLLCFTQCQPISYFWNSWDGEHQGRCIDLNIIGLAHIAVNISLDVVMLILPITQLYKLQMDRRKKLGVMAMFLEKSLTIVSCLRIKTLIAFSANATVDSMAVILWAYIELGVGVVVACMPNVRQFLKTLRTKVVQRSSSFTSRVSGSRTAVKSQAYQDRPGKLFVDTTMTATTMTTMTTITTPRKNSIVASSVASYEGGGRDRGGGGDSH